MRFRCLMMTLLLLSGLATISAQEIEQEVSIIDSGNPELNDLMKIAADFSVKTGQAMNGFRIRIGSFSGQTSRSKSEEALKEFQEKYPSIPAYRVYSEPDYKIYVGDYRTKTDAYRNLLILQTEYPTAFIVNSKIQLPDLNPVEIQQTNQ